MHYAVDLSVSAGCVTDFDAWLSKQRPISCIFRLIISLRQVPLHTLSGTCAVLMFARHSLYSVLCFVETFIHNVKRSCKLLC